MKRLHAQKAKIADLNDRFRQWKRHGLSHLHFSPGISALDLDTQVNALIAIHSYGFSNRPDFSGERRFGTVEINKHLIYWKILYRQYDWNHRQDAAPDPADGRKTRRVLVLWDSHEGAYDPEHT